MCAYTLTVCIRAGFKRCASNARTGVNFFLRRCWLDVGYGRVDMGSTNMCVDKTRNRMWGFVIDCPQNILESLEME